MAHSGAVTQPGRSPSDGRPWVVAVVGGGVTGASWAGLFAAHAAVVRLYDCDPRVATDALDRAAGAARFLRDRRLADASEAARGLSVLRAAESPEEALAGIDLLQECVVEDLGAKRDVFRVADELAPPEALLATSSSGLSITEIQQAAARHPERCLAAHPYNPPHLVPLVELAGGAHTSAAALARATALYRSVGKEPLLVRDDLPGYIANRLSAALWREAIDLVVSGKATVEEVDRAVRSGPGLRWAVMGPHLLYDLGGGEQGIRGHLAHLGAVKERMLRDLATWTAFPEGTADALAAGIADEVGSVPRAELEARRDETLAALLVALKQ